MTARKDAAPPPVDHDARERARSDFATSLVIEAGAGTGKTTLLVDRLLALLLGGQARLDQIAAVTFTENAATTMKLRLRNRLEEARADLGRPAVERQRAGDALEMLERAQVSTIHALCAAILGERPLDCGVLPGFRTADDAEMELLVEEAWEEWLAGALQRGDEAILAALDAGVPIETDGAWGARQSLRGLARVLIEQRDLEPLLADQTPDPPAWRTEMEEKAARAQVLAGSADAGDLLAQGLLALVRRAADLRALEGHALVQHLTRTEGIRRNYGRRASWPSPEAFDEAKAIAEWTNAAPARWKACLSADLHARLVRSLRGVVGIYERRKRERGALDFDDLLLRARNALRDSAAVRAHVQRRFPYLVIDEFQDTDPLQVEIARLIAADRPGALVVVGDAKQSIYRFRRADVLEFQRLVDEARAQPGRAVLCLSQNFRSRPALLRFVNRAFAEILVRDDVCGQPGYEPVFPEAHLADQPAVVALRFPASLLEGTDLLKAEAAALAAWISAAARGAEDVRDPVSGDTRKSRAGDVMVLSRRLTHVRVLEDALEAAGLTFSVEGGKSFFDRQEVHEVLACCRAIDDPSDRVSLLAALRSSFFGVSDRDLAAFVLSGGRLWIGEVDLSLPGAGAIGPALALLGDLHRRRTGVSVAALLERLYDQTRILAALSGARRGEAQAANLEKVAALARKSSELDVLTLRGFVRLLDARIRTAREEPDLPSTRPGDPDTVRVLTVHKAKGLEAPLVCLYDSADDFDGYADLVPLRDQGLVAIGFRAGCQPPGWDALRAAESARAVAEGRRLLYVAATRARDRLVVPVPPEDARSGAFWRELVRRLPAHSDADVEVVDAETLPAVLAPDEPEGDLRALAGSSGGDAVAALWEGERKDLLDEASHRPFVPISATRHVAGRAPAPVAAAESGGGRDFGSLVHRILEWIPLDQPDRAEAMAAALAPSFGLDAASAGRAGDAARRALDLPVMRRARAAKRLWRELPLWLPEDGRLIEGIADLVFEEDGALVLVDYKTDHIAPEHALAQAAHHAPQLQVYGRGLAQATGLRVRERLVLFTAIGQTVPV